MDKKVAVAILNWNGLDHLKSFLPSVVKHSTQHAEVWVIDNASDDESVDYLKTNFPEVKLIQLDKNHGFAGGYNRGLEKIDADYFVLLNSDVEVTPNWIPPVIDFMERSNGMKACQPKILDYKRKEWFEHAGAAGGFIDKDGFVFCAGRLFADFEKDRGQYNTNEEVFWASGASLFVDAKAYREVGGLDSHFFAHMEEIDLCWRLKNRGYKVGACRESAVYHLGGGTLQKINPFKTYLNFRNNLFLITKNVFTSPLPYMLFKRMVLDGIAAFRFLAEGKPSYFVAVFKAHFSFYGNLSLMLKKRKAEKKHVGSINLKGLYKKSILLEYFLRKKKTFHELDEEMFW
ncbi:glycosyltransferase family 2 protein [Halocola ammonii]